MMNSFEKLLDTLWKKIRIHNFERLLGILCDKLIENEANFLPMSVQQPLTTPFLKKKTLANKLYNVSQRQMYTKGIQHRS